MLAERPAVRSQLETELVGWLTTVGPDGQPQASAVWHVVDDDDIVVYSRPDATRLANLAANPRVAYNLRGDPQGDHIVTMEGSAAVDPELPGVLQNPAYLAKYEAEMGRLGWTPEQYHAEFPVALRITITRIRAW